MEDLIPTDDGRTPLAGELAEAVYAIRPELNDQLIEVINELANIADRDCYGEGEEGKPCDCEPCTAKRAIRTINRIRLPVVRSLRPERLNYAEKVYFDAWVKQNTRVSCVNYGYGTLELLLRHDRETTTYIKPAYVSQRDMDVATTVIQWLGTNCGRCFIETCEREWKARQEERRDFEHVTHITEPWKEYREKPIYARIADSIAEKYPIGDNRERLATEIRKAMLYAKNKAQVELTEEQFKP